MRRFIIIIASTTSMLCFFRCSEQKNSGSDLSEGCESEPGLTRVFIQTHLQDSLSAFLKKMDAFPKPINVPLLPVILLEIQNKDTVITFRADIGIPYEVHWHRRSRETGIRSDGKDIIVLYYNRITEAPHLFNESNFDDDIYMKQREKDDSIRMQNPSICITYTPHIETFNLKEYR